MTHVRNIDALIAGIPEAHPINPANSPVNKPEVQPESVKIEPETQIDSDVKGTELTEKDANLQENAEKDVNFQEKSENSEKTTATNENTDEYGNPIPKAKMYTEEEVQRMIRERLKRGAFREQAEAPPIPQQQQPQGPTGFEYNDASEQTWEQQLEAFVENTIDKRDEKKQRKAIEVQQQRVQAEFEGKMFDGMDKYPDFMTTMEGKHITNDMMKGIRGLDNPAAFLYAAAKRAPAELNRIANIQDPYAQVAEMGRLHERLAKPKSSSNAPRPVGVDRSDVSDKSSAKVSIDHLIAEDSRKRYRQK